MCGLEHSACGPTKSGTALLAHVKGHAHAHITDGSAGIGEKHLVRSVMAVSYTHLDVYKRQVYT